MQKSKNPAVGRLPELFLDGEAAFRVLEHETLAQLVARAGSSAVIAEIGCAGFEGPLPQGVRTVWLQRPTDSQGRSSFFKSSAVGG